MSILKSQAKTWLNLLPSFLIIATGATPTPEPTNLITPVATTAVSGEGTTLLIFGALCLVLIILAGVIWNVRIQKS